MCVCVFIERGNGGEREERRGESEKNKREREGEIVRKTENSSGPRCQEQSGSEPRSCKTVIPRRKHQQ